MMHATRRWFCAAVITVGACATGAAQAPPANVSRDAPALQPKPRAAKLVPPAKGGAKADRTRTRAAPAPTIEFVQEAPKDVPPKLARFELKTFSNGAAFEALRNGKLPMAAPQGESPLPKESLQVAGMVQARVDPMDGSFEIYASFNALREAAPKPLGVDTLLERLTPQLHHLVPSDPHSKVFVEGARLLQHAQLKRGAKPSEGRAEDQPRLLFVSLRRRIGELPVDGPGSRITVGLDGNGVVRAARYEWKLPVERGTLEAGSTPDEVTAAVREALSGVEITGTVRVKRIELVYVDDGKELAPAYRYVAELIQTAEGRGGSDHLTGYVPYSKGQQGLPKLGATALASTVARKPAAAAKPLQSALSSTLLIHRFVVREDSTAWHTAAEEFSNAIDLAAGPVNFKSAPYLGALPHHFSGRKDEFLNAADIALVEAHGFPFGFTTLGNFGDRILIEHDIPRSGLGPASGGRLKHWMLHSCESVPTAAEYPEYWAKQWWELFKGLGSVIGYRSSMFISDGAGAALAPSLRAGAPVIASWFNAVAALNIYSLDSEAMFACEPKAFPMGRPAAINACDYADLPASERGPDQPECLEAWWLADLVTQGEVSRRPPAEAGTKPKNCPEIGGPGIGNYDPPAR